jgi:oxygen-independent coproporphyrinogen-3 oxidase
MQTGTSDKRSTSPLGGPKDAGLRVLEQTKPGNYFVSNYPPYSFWKPEHAGEACAALERPAQDTPLGIYVHIPFCRKRCHFCYFKVYTDKNAREVEAYVDAVLEELRLYAGMPAVANRRPQFVYFGGGTPSYISSAQLRHLVESMRRLVPWDESAEIAFECEPGTLTEGKLEVIRSAGVTRLSLGIENFDDTILKVNGRAHAAKEIDRSYSFARSIGFPQINIDLIAGMVGETEANWRDCIRKTIDLDPDSVTIYQMEIPYNTTIFQDMKSQGQTVAPVAGWEQKREWVKYAFAELESAGYTVGSAYTAVKNPENSRFLYRDLLWHGADMLGLGVASFSHVQGVHFQNEHEFDAYCDKVRQGKPPVFRALALTEEERMIREFILQMKLGHIANSYFRDKFGVDVEQRFAAPLGRLRSEGLLVTDGKDLRLHREGLLRVDGLLPQFFLPEHQTSRVA